MSRLMLAMLSIALMVTLVVAVPAGAQPFPEGEPFPGEEFFPGQEFDFEPFKIKLRGFTVVPAISTEGTGKFEIDIVGEVDSEEIELEAIETLEYILSYDFPLGTTVIGAELRLGRKLTNGGMIAVLCETDADPVSTGAPTCPASEGSVEGLITAASIVGPIEQGIAPKEFLKALQAFEKGAVYVSVRTVEFPNGEIRGQLNDFDFRPIFIGGPGGPFPCGPGGPGGPGEPFPCGNGPFPGGPDGFPCDLSVGPCGPGPNDGFFPDGEHDGDFPCDPNDPNAGFCGPEPNDGFFPEGEHDGDFPCKPDDGQEQFPCDPNDGQFPEGPDGFPCVNSDGSEGSCEPDPFDPNAGGEPDPFDPNAGGEPDPFDPGTEGGSDSTDPIGITPTPTP